MIFSNISAFPLSLSKSFNPAHKSPLLNIYKEQIKIKIYFFIYNKENVPLHIQNKNIY